MIRLDDERPVERGERRLETIEGEKRLAATKQAVEMIAWTVSALS